MGGRGLPRYIKGNKYLKNHLSVEYMEKLLDAAEKAYQQVLHDNKFYNDEAAKGMPGETKKKMEARENAREASVRVNETREDIKWLNAAIDRKKNPTNNARRGKKFK